MRDLDSIARWKRNTDHLIAQRLGRKAWYERYAVRIARVERAYDLSRRDASGGALDRD